MISFFTFFMCSPPTYKQHTGLVWFGFFLLLFFFYLPGYGKASQMKAHTSAVPYPTDLNPKDWQIEIKPLSNVLECSLRDLILFQGSQFQKFSFDILGKKKKKTYLLNRS